MFRLRVYGPGGAAVPAITAVISAASSTERQSGPTVSNPAASAEEPVTGISPIVVFHPTRFCQTEGMRTDPPVSVPRPTAARPAATAAADPPLDPPTAQRPVADWALLGPTQDHVAYRNALRVAPQEGAADADSLVRWLAEWMEAIGVPKDGR